MKSTPWLARLVPGRRADARLFCFPYAGSGAHAFDGWRRNVPGGMEVVGVSLPGRETHRSADPLENWEPLMEALTIQLQPALAVPYVLFGHSLGARIAYELVHRFGRLRLPLPATLFVSGCRAPGVPARNDPMHALEFRALLTRLRSMGGVPAEVLQSERMMRFMEPALRADLKLAETWEGHRGKISTAIVALSGTADEVDPVEDMRPWCNFTSGRFDHHVFDGGHFFLHERQEDVLSVIVSSVREAPLPRKCTSSDSRARPTFEPGAVEALAPYPAASVSRLFEEQASNRPDAPAVRFRHRSTSYRDLNRGANRLAKQLIADGVVKSDIVALAMPRTPLFVAGLLATLKVGAVYLPVDSSWPTKRLAEILRDAGVRYLLMEPGAPAPPLTDIGIVRAHDPFPADADDSKLDANPDIDTSLEDPAYVNFTSGSSGKPKGVPILHRGVVSLVFPADYVPLSEETVTLQLAAPSFDAMTFELWAPLLHGGTCVLFDGSFPVLSRLRETIRDDGVTTLFLTTALFNLIVDEAPDILEPVRYLLTGGEAHSIRHMRRASRLLPDVAVSSVYGPTEATTFATHFPLAELGDDSGSVPLGRAIANREVHVFRDDRTRCDVGETGEIWIAGPGLATGYLGRPNLNRERFVSVTDGTGRTTRFYRTGDLGRVDGRGLVEFLGRNDYQVKINGYRVELEEVERAIVAFEGVKGAAVLPHGDGPNRSLKAVVAANGDVGAALPAFLRSHLPGYMIPTAYRTVDRLPMNGNGKIDRKALGRLFDDRA